MEDRDLYEILGVARGASEDEIRSAYRKLARQYHPDVNPNDPKAEERFKEVSFANDILQDPEKRSRYDQFGSAGLAEGFDSGQARAYSRWSQGAQRSPYHESFTSQMDLDDLLSGLFGGRAGPGARGPAPGRDAQGEIPVDFLDAVLGNEVRVQFEGKGALRIRIPPGAESGTKIRLAGQGAPGSDGSPAGDLYLTLQVRPHPFLTRQGSDLFVDLPVTLSELVLGASVEVPTPDGPVQMKIPPRSPNGRKLRLRGKGASQRGGGRGDLYLKLVCQLPAELDDEAQGKLENLARELEPLYEPQDLRAHLKDRS
ncbi:MAG: DnaJ C-terminal domain-containing protein [Myxococcota bacterium]|nr:DnaJ C-terminal domain-containing protein [Myxococcota bacterium]